MSLIETALQDLDVTVDHLDYGLTGLHAQVLVRTDQIQPLCSALHANGFFLETVTAVDRLAEGTMQGVYLFNHYKDNARLKVQAESDRKTPVFPSIGAIYPGAVWHEREAGEFFGITYEGSKDSRCLLLPPDTAFHPLRKDFKRPEWLEETT